MPKKTTMGDKEQADTVYLETITRLQLELNQTQLELSQAIHQRNKLFLQLQNYESLKSQSKMLLVSIRKKYRRQIDKLKDPAKLKRTIHMPDLSKYETHSEIFDNKIKAYDKKSLRETRVLNGRIRRVAYSLLDNLDRLSIKLLKQVFRTFRTIKHFFRQLLKGSG